MSDWRSITSYRETAANALKRKSRKDEKGHKSAEKTDKSLEGRQANIEKRKVDIEAAIRKAHSNPKYTPKPKHDTPRTEGTGRDQTVLVILDGINAFLKTHEKALQSASDKLDNVLHAQQSDLRMILASVADVQRQAAQDKADVLQSIMTVLATVKAGHEADAAARSTMWRANDGPMISGLDLLAAEANLTTTVPTTMFGLDPAQTFYAPLGQVPANPLPFADVTINADILNDPALQCLFEAFTTNSMSTGIETLPSDCTRDTADQAVKNMQVQDSTALKERREHSRALRNQVQSLNYVSHPMDGPMRHGATTSVATEDDRNIRGRSAIPAVKFLPASDGRKAVSRGKWPKKGENTLNGRLREIECDECHGVVHWACAGFEDHDKVREEPWNCPECDVIMDQAVKDGSTPEFPKLQKDRCMRPDCILRALVPIKRKDGDIDRFVIERIVGRRTTGRRANQQRVFEYLVKWEDWPSYDSTWEPVKNIDEFTHFHDRFTVEAREAQVDMRWKVAILPEMEEYFDDNGDLKIFLLEQQGIELKTWWM